MRFPEVWRRVLFLSIITFLWLMGVESGDWTQTKCDWRLRRSVIVAFVTWWEKRSGRTLSFLSNGTACASNQKPGQERCREMQGGVHLYLQSNGSITHHSPPSNMLVMAFWANSTPRKVAAFAGTALAMAGPMPGKKALKPPEA
jgi:hypothetical protein